uniref:Uncharacterized protein n=1 Tax=Anguilla anguilla TaxID=7936 RepID=A0A0E9WH36_ANGAN
MNGMLNGFSYFTEDLSLFESSYSLCTPLQSPVHPFRVMMSTFVCGVTC